MRTHQPWRAFGTALLLFLSWAGAALCGAPADRIVGTWRGTSTCVDRVAAPACNDEVVVYEIERSAGKPDSVTTKEDKLVDGKRVPMGVLEFKRGVTEDAWLTEFETPRVHGRWELLLSGDQMTGTLLLLPSKTVVRRMSLVRDK